MTTNGKYQHGFALGKFLPFHKGHEALLRFGIESSERFTILVCSLPSDAVPGSVRVQWAKRLFPSATVAHLDNPAMPQEPKDHPAFWQLWLEAVVQHAGTDVDAVFASEPYGWQLAEEVGAQFISFDMDRNRFPVSGTAVRANPGANFEFLPDPVRAYYTKRIAILGPESAGKTTLATELADFYKTKPVIEYARPMFDALVLAGKRKPGEFRYEDLSQVARGQVALEDTLAEASNGVLICDTDVLTTMTWSEFLYHKVEPWIETLAMQRTYDLTLVLHPEDNEYVQDGQRIMTELDTRMAFFKTLCANLEKAGRPYEVLRGKRGERLDLAIDSVNRLLGK